MRYRHIFNTKKSSIELFFDKVSIYFNMFCHVLMGMIVSYANCRCIVTTEKHRALHSIFNSFNTLLIHISAHTPCPIAWNSYYALLLGFLPPLIVSCCAKLHDFPKLCTVSRCGFSITTEPTQSTSVNAQTFRSSFFAASPRGLFQIPQDSIYYIQMPLSR